MTRLIEQLQKHKDNRGMMANLRCVLAKNKKHRAWPILNRLGISIDDDISAYIAGLFATHPESTDKGNLGTTCNTIETQRGEKHSDDSKLTPIERRFQHLLTAEPGRELFDRVLRIVLMAKAQGVPINYAKLATDLKFWPSDRTKREWATGFWAQDAKPLTKEAI